MLATTTARYCCPCSVVNRELSQYARSEVAVSKKKQAKYYDHTHEYEAGATIEIHLQLLGVSFRIGFIWFSYHLTRAAFVINFGIVQIY